MLFSSSLVLAASLLSLPVQGRNVRRSTSPIKQTLSKATAFQSPSTLTVSDNVLTLSRSSNTGAKLKSGASNAARAKSLVIATGNSVILTSLFEGEEFVAPITFGTETFQVIVDTGSSDTWVVETGFSCVDVDTSKSLPESDCAFGPTYNLTSTFSEISGQNFNITYGDGEFLTGFLGKENITLAGISVNQTMAVVDFAAWEGDGVSSGLVGFSYPALTSAYNGTDPTLDNSAAGEQIEYDPIFTTMYKEGLVAPLFSLAIERNLSGPSGYLALGGVPPVDFVQNFTETPILITSIEGYPKALDFYTIAISGLSLAGTTLSGSSKATYIVDSGTTLNYLPTTYADAVNAAFVPPAVYSDEDGAYIVECDAVAPSFGIIINGTTFFTNALDMILPSGTDDEGNEICISGIDDGGSDLDEDVFILGDTFQKNVVTVFDVGAGVLKFAARENYPSDDTY